MILVVVNKKKCVFFLFFRNFSVFLFFLGALVQKEGKSRGESKERVLDVT
jgi:hypothetical protein